MLASHSPKSFAVLPWGPIVLTGPTRWDNLGPTLFVQPFYERNGYGDRESACSQGHHLVASVRQSNYRKLPLAAVFTRSVQRESAHFPSLGFLVSNGLSGHEK